MTGRVDDLRHFWDRLARADPLWAILSDPARKGRRWEPEAFIETGRREISLLMHQLRQLDIQPGRAAALDFGCGVGRLTQPLAAYFDRVVGVDVSPEMVRLAERINAHSDRVRYICNVRADLSVLDTAAFTFAYTDVVLQHLEPELALEYLAELLRVLAPGGVLVFQLPSHRIRVEERPRQSVAMPDAAYRASIAVETELPAILETQATAVLQATIRNDSSQAWIQQEAGAIRFGNHWLDASGERMLIQDDGRAALPDRLDPGASCSVSLLIRTPREPGRYQLECDLVHEGITWFADRGSRSWRRPVEVAGKPTVSNDHESTTSSAPERQTDSSSEALAEVLRSLEPAPPVDPPAFPMNGVPREDVERFLLRHGGRLAHVERDERCGAEWMGFRYFVTRPPADET
jgi:SAM-dependent methyltransferase